MDKDHMLQKLVTIHETTATRYTEILCT
eukprot:Gb_27711 [translate_table: standard]